MIVRAVVKKNEFYDSVLLMRISEEANKLEGIEQAAVLMGTHLNKEVLGSLGLFTNEILESGPNDLVIAVQAKTEDGIQKALVNIDHMLQDKRQRVKAAYSPKSLSAALDVMPDANLVLISVPGEFAKREAKKALENGLHVFLFSSNVPVEDELELKQLARRKGALVMGPDCGTSVINNVILGFGNAVNTGPVGIVAASGTGIQQASTIIHRLGSGISQAIGTGGRDISDEIGAITMLEGIRLVEEHEKTEVILLISKPPSREITEKVISAAKSCKKTVIVNFIGVDAGIIEKTGLIFATTLEDAAHKAVAVTKGERIGEIIFTLPKEKIASIAKTEQSKLTPNQKYVRGLFSGGTLCYESLSILSRSIGTIYSNIPLEPDLKLSNTKKSYMHTCLDLGTDEFVIGRPHPMIDPTLRQQKILEEARDPETAVVLLDFVIGYGSHSDPAGALVPAIIQGKKESEEHGRYLPVLASVIGTELDYQDLRQQVEKLNEAGVIVLPSNAQATRIAALIATRSNLLGKAFGK